MKRRFSPLILCLGALTGANTANATAPVEAAETPDAEQVEDPIFALIDLPLIAQEARGSGIDADDVQAVLELSVHASVGGIEIASILTAELEAKRGPRGPKTGLAHWVRQQVAEGVHGKDLAAKIHERKDDTAAPSESDKATLDAKLAKRKAEHEARRQAAAQKREEWIKAGKKLAVSGHKEHDDRKKFLAEHREELKARYTARKLVGHGAHGGEGMADMEHGRGKGGKRGP